ncbi:hypothetical protein [Streptomyces alboflavus]|uniref:hypothetical protein n=1 Tax=Streptomyces alboflavus TaxID=67267 RepID=UPI000F6563F4|nr:hypothetical protein [Streptomyces alboflavus]
MPAHGWADDDVESALAAPARGWGPADDLPRVLVGPPPAAGRVLTPSGRSLSAAAARRVHESVPHNTWRNRESRTALFGAWCREHGRIATDPGTVPDYVAHLADLGHQPETLEAYVGALVPGLELSGHPLDAEDRSYIAAIINHRAAEAADDPDGAGDALQSAECSREDLAAMLATLDRSTVAGRRDALALALDWYMAGRSCEPGALDLRDVAEVTAEFNDPTTGEVLHLDALAVTVRRSKTNVYGRTTETVRIVAQDDATCPLAAYRAWRPVLAAAGVERGPLLRRVRNERLTTAGRPPRDPARVGGIGARTIRNLIATTAAAADLTRELTADERRLLSTRAEQAEAAALAEEERAAFAAERRRARRLLRASLVRYSGHSMRRGHVRHLQKIGTPRHIIEAQCRYVYGSSALARYLDERVPWAENPTVLMRRAARAAPRERPLSPPAGPGLRG